MFSQLLQICYSKDMRESIFFRHIHNTMDNFPSMRSRHHSHQDGFTMIEVLVVAVILAILILASVINMPIFIARANDSRRKSDLEAFTIAIERYYEENGKCYPDADKLSVCNSITAFSPYLPKVLCDPQTKNPYTYVKENCSTYKMYTALQDVKDPDITKIGCGDGCGPDANGDGKGDYNYGVSSANTNPGNPVGTGVAGTCTINKKQNRCYPNLCSVCCPGSGFRCNATGNLCIADVACQ